MKKSELVKFVIAQKQKKLAAINAKINEHKIILAEAEINRLGLLPLFEYLKPSIDDYKKIIGCIRAENGGASPLNERIEFGDRLYLRDTNLDSEKVKGLLINIFKDFVKADDFIIQNRKLVNKIDDEFEKVLSNVRPMKSAKKIYEFLITLGFTDNQISPYLTDEQALVLTEIDVSLIK